jgi:hypothetical protein
MEQDKASESTAKAMEFSVGDTEVVFVARQLEEEDDDFVHIEPDAVHSAGTSDAKDAKRVVGKPLQVSAKMLATHSPVLAKRLSPVGKSLCLEVADDKDAQRHALLIRFIYERKLEGSLPAEDIVQLMFLADKLQVEALVAACGQALQSLLEQATDVRKAVVEQAADVRKAVVEQAADVRKAVVEQAADVRKAVVEQAADGRALASRISELIDGSRPAAPLQMPAAVDAACRCVEVQLLRTFHNLNEMLPDFVRLPLPAARIVLHSSELCVTSENDVWWAARVWATENKADPEALIDCVRLFNVTSQFLADVVARVRGQDARVLRALAYLTVPAQQQKARRNLESASSRAFARRAGYKSGALTRTFDRKLPLSKVLEEPQIWEAGHVAGYRCKLSVEASARTSLELANVSVEGRTPLELANGPLSMFVLLDPTPVTRSPEDLYTISAHLSTFARDPTDGSWRAQRSCDFELTAGTEPWHGFRDVFRVPISAIQNQFVDKDGMLELRFVIRVKDTAWWMS